MVGDVDARIGQMGIVERFEGIELVGTLLGGAIATQQRTIEIDTDFRNACMTLFIFGGSNLDAGNQVLFAVGAQLFDGQL